MSGPFHRPIVTLAVAVVAVGLARSGPPAGAQSSGRPRPSRDPAVLAADGRNPNGVIVATSPALDGVPVTSVEFDGASARRAGYAADLADANHRVDTTTASLLGLERDRAALADLIERAGRRERKLTSSEARFRDALRSMAVERYVQGSTADHFPDPDETVDEALQRAHETRIAAEAERRVRRGGDVVHRRLAETRASIDDMVARRDHGADEIASVTTERKRALTDVDVATAALVAAEAEVRAARPMTVVAGSDLPLVGLDAYWRAANDLAATQPECRLRWWALAGIGRTESNHGRSGGGRPGPDGRVTVPIVGVALDGTAGHRAVPDTDGGAMDLDPTWDRAVGPMQFLPGTWKRYAEDQSGDRQADPQNVYDAALAAAKLLCTHGPGLDDDDRLREAYHAYNRSDAYVELVLDRAHEYEQLPVPPGQAAG